MQRSQALLFILLTWGLVAAKSNLEDDESVIEALDYEYYAKARDEEVRRTCRFDVMMAYGLGGDAPTLGHPNTVCPSVTRNCCGPRDIERLPKLWKTVSKRHAIHNRIVLLIFKFILGNGKNWDALAGKIMSAYEMGPPAASKDDKKEGDNALSIKPTKTCYESAKRILELGFGEREKAEFYYMHLTQRAQFMHNTRRGVYCMLCSAEGQDAVFNSPAIISWFYSDRVYYNREFCRMLVDFSFRISYELSKTYNGYLRDLLNMTSCVKAPGVERKDADSKATVVVPDVSDNVLKHMIKNPLDLDAKVRLELCDLATGSNFLVFEKCEYWCQKWKATKPVSLFDGNALAMERLYRHMVRFEEALGYNANLFRSDETKMKNDIEDLLKVRYKATTFMKPISGYMDLSKFKSDFVYSKRGVNPLAMVKDGTLEFEYTGARVLAVFGLAAALFLL